MSVTVHFYSYFKELAGCAEVVETVASGATIAQLLPRVFERFPRLSGMQNSMLVAVGVDYQNKEYVLQEGDEVSFFPPVQGG